MVIGTSCRNGENEKRRQKLTLPDLINENLSDVSEASLPMHITNGATTYTSKLSVPEGSSRKRKYSAERSEDEGFKLVEESGKKQCKQWFQGLRIPELLYPKSSYQGHEHNAPVQQEKAVLQRILVRSTGKNLESLTHSVSGRRECYRASSVNIWK